MGSGYLRHTFRTYFSQGLMHIKLKRQLNSAEFLIFLQSDEEKSIVEQRLGLTNVSRDRKNC
jgi:hypothetical protein